MSRRKPPEVSTISLPGTHRILGIDPGSYRTGWGLLGGSFHHPALIDSGVIRIATRGAFSFRLSQLQRELDQLVAPIALYPDTLLSQVLIAATYPLDCPSGRPAIWSSPDCTPP